MTLSEWQHFYNWQRTHSSLKGKTPIKKVFSLLANTSLSEVISANYDIDNKRIQESNYQVDLVIRKTQTT